MFIVIKILVIWGEFNTLYFCHKNITSIKPLPLVKKKGNLVIIIKMYTMIIYTHKF